MTEILSPLALMKRLVGFPTVSRDSNLDLIAFVEGYLDSHGISSTRVPDATGEKAALYAHVGPQIEGAVVLSGHTDVVPVDGQAWVTDPFVVTEKDGKYFGRGTCDMKGFDALAIWALVEAHRRGVRRPLQLALSYDEEVGCTRRAADDRRHDRQRNAERINGDYRRAFDDESRDRSQGRVGFFRSYERV